MKYHRIVQAPKGEVQFIEDEIADPRPGEIRLKIQAAGVSFADMLMREGIHPEARRGPFTPGWDVVGVVEKLGNGVTSAKVEDMVAAMPIVGGYAEYIRLPETELVPVPAHADPAEAVCMVLNYTTAHQMLHRSAKAKPDENALIHSAPTDRIRRVYNIWSRGYASFLSPQEHVRHSALVPFCARRLVVRWRIGVRIVGRLHAELAHLGGTQSQADYDRAVPLHKKSAICR